MQICARPSNAPAPMKAAWLIANRELQIIRAGLENRVAERTADLERRTGHARNLRPDPRPALQSRPDASGFAGCRVAILAGPGRWGLIAAAYSAGISLPQVSFYLVSEDQQNLTLQASFTRSTAELNTRPTPGQPAARSRPSQTAPAHRQRRRRNELHSAAGRRPPDRYTVPAFFDGRFPTGFERRRRPAFRSCRRRSDRPRQPDCDCHRKRTIVLSESNRSAKPAAGLWRIEPQRLAKSVAHPPQPGLPQPGPRPARAAERCMAGGYAGLSPPGSPQPARPTTRLDLPIQIRQQVTGMLRLRKHAASGAWSPAERELAQALAERLSAALESARLYEETRRRAEHRTPDRSDHRPHPYFQQPANHSANRGPGTTPGLAGRRPSIRNCYPRCTPG